jgi:hypothetical protein
MTRASHHSSVAAVFLAALASCYPWEKFPTAGDCTSATPDPSCDPAAGSTCETAADCGAALACIGGQCSQCSVDSECVPGEACRGGACTALCDRSLDQLVSARASAVVVAPACVYRETVTLSRPVTLVGRKGAEIRGSDLVPSEKWVRSGARWSTPARAPQQVFLDGKELTLVAGAPLAGQFTVDTSGNVVIAEDPQARSVELTSRSRWIITGSRGVTVRNFTMRHASGGADDGAVGNDGFDDWALERNVLQDARGSVVALRRSSNARLEGNDIGRAGWRGVVGSGGSAWTLSGNTVHDCGAAGPTPRTDGGGGSAGVYLVDATGVVFDKHNVVARNKGPGLRCERCNDVTVGDSRFEGNTGAGVLLRSGSRAVVANVVAVDNGWGPPAPDWGWGAGVLLLDWQDASVSDNIAAWNADGIAILSQGQRLVTNVAVTRNTILAADYALSSNDDDYALLWGQDQPTTPSMFEAAANNRGEDNLFWYAAPEGARARYGWAGAHIDKLAELSTKPGGLRSVPLDDAKKNELVKSHELPAGPSHP